ncbi:MAG TPA: hypothetical protein VK990_04520 [Acidimicrobiia bacterium]|nr:hypothetical protein [Acidimicrobiia bacterium]
MRKASLLLALVVVVTACGLPNPAGGGDGQVTTTTVDPDQPVDSDGDEPITDPVPVGSVPNPRPPIPGNIDGEVWITGADLRIMESYPIQVMLDVSGEKPTPCHEVFWTAEDDGAAIRIEMISQVASDQVCAQMIEPFTIAVPLGSWEGEDREVQLNDEVVGSFQS